MAVLCLLYSHLAVKEFCISPKSKISFAFDSRLICNVSESRDRLYTTFSHKPTRSVQNSKFSRKYHQNSSNLTRHFPMRQIGAFRPLRRDCTKRRNHRVKTSSLGFPIMKILCDNTLCSWNNNLHKILWPLKLAQSALNLWFHRCSSLNWW